MQYLAEIGLVGIPQILGNPKATPPSPPLIPVSKSTWCEGVRTGRFPKPVQLGGHMLWRVEDIRALIVRIGGAQ